MEENIYSGVLVCSKNAAPKIFVPQWWDYWQLDTYLSLTSLTLAEPFKLELQTVEHIPPT